MKFAIAKVYQLMNNLRSGLMTNVQGHRRWGGQGESLAHPNFPIIIGVGHLEIESCGRRKSKSINHFTVALLEWVQWVLRNPKILSKKALKIFHYETNKKPC